MSGPNPNAACVFPFIYKGRQYGGCPIDPDDRTKRWCSTRVDSNGVHVGGQGQYGHCGSGCPRDNVGNPVRGGSGGGGGGTGTVPQRGGGGSGGGRRRESEKLFKL